jgi:hypothetical protein
MPRPTDIDIARAIAVVLMLRGERDLTITRLDYEKMDRLFDVTATVAGDGGRIAVRLDEKQRGQKQLPLPPASPQIGSNS